MLTRRQAIGAAVAGATALVRGATNVFATVPQPATPVNFAVPPGATDTHRHVIGDMKRFPFAPTSRYRHEPATIEDMRTLDRALHIDRVVLMAVTGYATDNSCLLDGLRQLGSRARGIVIIDAKTPDKQLDDWDRVGIRGIRLNQGGQTVPEARQRLQAAAQRLAGRKWHINTMVQLSMLEDLQDQFMGSPVPIVIDHFVGAQASRGVQQPGFEVLLHLLRAGAIYVKLSREHTISEQGPDYPDVAPLAKALIAANPQRILWATDWPHAGIVPPGYKATDISPYLQIDDGRLFNQFALWAPDPVVRKTILVDNPARLYGF